MQFNLIKNCRPLQFTKGLTFAREHKHTHTIIYIGLKAIEFLGNAVAVVIEII